MKNIIKILVAIVMTLGFSFNSNAQIFEFIQKAAEAANTIMETSERIGSAVNANNNNNNNNQPAYRAVTNVSMISWGSYGSTNRSSAAIVVDDSGTKMVYKNDTTYSIYENSSYDPYSSDSNSPAYYRYYAYVESRMYYFNM